ncbi:S49 family peptidase [Haloferax sulfurifontis]|uniref:Peptidase S49 n=1 Tax=Haloferax sulfurifontis ATCC BAA-897 TaxID=662480 RepID=M0IKW0_9EURY|nr:S49 family peptidase [Haloferax sulfurifontis]ELZ96677.1 peptidase S49 [Haloferax sulfurifontis ATCC BAA-897]
MVPIRKQTRTAIYVVAVVAALITGGVLAPVAWEYTSAPDGTVAVVTLDGAITPASAERVIQDLHQVRNNDNVDAVVLRVNSPGGTVAASESLYLAVKETADEKPVVANVAGQAASGGYMAILGSDYVYATPSSQLGSVGVYGSVPPIQLSNIEGIVTTAPTKGTGGTAEEVRHSVERMKQTFVGLVLEERGDALTVNRETVSRAKVYNGIIAVENGFADGIGGRQAAIDEAAERANIEDYRVVTLENNGKTSNTNTSLSFENIDTPQYLALHGVPDEKAVTPLEVADTNRTTQSMTEDKTGTSAQFVEASQ